MRKWGVRFRDVVYIDPSLPLPLPSVVLVRARAILVHLDAGGSLRMVIAENQCLVLSVPKAEDPRLTALPTLRHPLVRRLCRCLRPALPSRITITLLARPSMAESGADRSPRGGGGAANGGGGAFDADMPYELRALEVGLAAAVGILSAEIDAFEERSYPVVDELLHSVERSVLEGVRGVKSGVDRLRAKVQRIHQEIEVWCAFLNGLGICIRLGGAVGRRCGGAGLRMERAHGVAPPATTPPPRVFEHSRAAPAGAPG